MAETASRNHRTAGGLFLRVSRLSAAARVDRAAAGILIGAAARTFGRDTCDLDDGPRGRSRNDRTVLARRPSLHVQVHLGARGRRAGCAVPVTRAWAAARVARLQPARARGDDRFSRILDPVAAPFALAFAALMVAAASATQDIVIDAFRVESLDTSEQAAGMASYVFAYRIGMLVSGAGVIALVAWLELIGVPRDEVWTWGYIAAAAFVSIGLFAALMAREPDAPANLRAGRPRGDALSRVLTTAFEAFREFLTRDSAIAVLLFVVLFKFCDAFAGVLTGPVRDLDRLRQGGVCGDRQGCRSRRLARRRHRRWRRRARVAARHESVDRRIPADGVQLRLCLAGVGRRQSRRADSDDHRGKLHRRDRHRDLRGLSVCALSRPYAHGNAVRAAYGASRSRPHHPRVRRRLRRGGSRMDGVLHASRRSRRSRASILLAWLQSRGHFAQSGAEELRTACDCRIAAESVPSSR